MNKKLILTISFIATMLATNIHAEDTANSALTPQPQITSVIAESKKPEPQLKDSKDSLSDGFKSFGNPVVIAAMIATSIIGPVRTIGAIILICAAANHEKLIPIAQKKLESFKDKWKQTTEEALKNTK